MTSEVVVSVLVEGGGAKAGAAMGSQLGPLGVNINSVLKEINEKTAGFKGIQVPVKIIVTKETKSFKLEVGSPAVSQLIKSSLKAEKGSAKAGQEFIGDVKLDALREFAKSKIASNIAKDEKAMLKQIVGTCVSMGVKVDGRNPKDVIKGI